MKTTYGFYANAMNFFPSLLRSKYKKLRRKYSMALDAEAGTREK